MASKDKAKDPPKKNGRPTVVTEEALQKLEYAFSIGCTDIEACLYSDISKSTLYNYQNENPDFLERKEKLKETPVLKARTTVFDDIKQVDTAKWYLERKKRAEFSQRHEVEMPDGFNINVKFED